MMKYKAYIQQCSEGCDYTIACGKKVIDIEAESMDAAKVKLSEIIEEDYLYSEGRLGEVELYEINEVVKIDIDDIYKRIEDEAYRKKKEKEEEAERAEYLRLKQKFES